MQRSKTVEVTYVTEKTPTGWACDVYVSPGGDGEYADVGVYGALTRREAVDQATAEVIDRIAEVAR